jgi:hypothetical protein
MNALLAAVSPKPTRLMAQAVIPLADEFFVVGCTETDVGQKRPRVDGLVALRMKRDGTVVDRGSGTTVLADNAADCLRVGVLELPTIAAPWPVLDIRYKSEHPIARGSAVIEWSAAVDSKSMRLLRRVPVRAGLQHADGASRLELFNTRAVSPGVVELRARSSGRTVRVACADMCVMNPGKVLELVGEAESTGR